MKKPISLFLVLLIIIAAFAGCGNLQTADFEDPQAVVDAFLAEHSLEGDNVADIFNDFAGKTVRVKTNDKSDPVFNIYKKVTLYTGLYVILSDSDHGAVTDFDYNAGDTFVLEITEIMVRAYKDGQYRDIFIDVKLPA
jgi:hypothetical protein